MANIEISERPLTGLFGSESAYQVLMYLAAYDNGYASQIARTYKTPLSQVQKQLLKFEQLGLLISRREGTSRVFYFKQGPVSDALRGFLDSMLEVLPQTVLEKYYRERRRPRRYGKR